MADNPAPLIFSKGWLYLFLAVILISVIRIIQKIGVIQREGNLKARIQIIKPIDAVRRAAKRRAEGAVQEREHSGLRTRAEALEKELESRPVDEFPAEHCRLLMDLGETHRALSLYDDRKEELLRAARWFFLGSQARPPEGFQEEHGHFLARLGDTYTELSGIFERTECLGRAAASYGEALTAAGPGLDRERRAEIEAKLGGVLLDLADDEDREMNLVRAIHVLNDAVKGYSLDRDSTPYALAMYDLGRAFLKYAAVDDPKRNLLRAGKAVKEAMRVLTRENHPEHYEKLRILIEEVKAAYTRVTGEGQ
ncbi:MAG: hypothetical protein JSV26_08605 [bacterium]|nr:MAG: hypothetical protein JSV26_08605 [bacterium]